jgi:7-carboxy-7-deazaguanine synthase
MFGKNPKRKPVKGDGNILEIQEIFATLQGEGPYAGWPAVFVRLGGCNLACNFCDTEFESFQEMQLVEILSQIMGFVRRGNIQLVVITGGEPFRQPIDKLCYILLESGLMVQVETNGTLYHPVDERVDIVCSPKNTNGRYALIRADLLERISAFKFIISSHDSNYSGVAEVGQGKYNVPVYVQPMDEYDDRKNAENLDYTVKMSMMHGYRLSIQLHKLLGLR